MSARKKNKSSIKYGNYIYNELKERRKTKDTTSGKPKLSFVTLLETVFESIPYSKRIFSTTTLGGIPIVGNFYNRLNFIFNKQLQNYTNNFKILYISNYQIKKNKFIIPYYIDNHWSDWKFNHLNWYDIIFNTIDNISYKK